MGRLRAIEVALILGLACSATWAPPEGFRPETSHSDGLTARSSPRFESVPDDFPKPPDSGAQPEDNERATIVSKLSTELGLWNQHVASEYDDFKRIISTEGSTNPQDVPKLVEAAIRAAHATEGFSPKPLPAPHEWLSIRSTGDDQQALLALSARIAAAAFDHPFHLDQVAVLASGLNSNSMDAIRSAASPARLKETQRLLQFLSDPKRNWQSHDDRTALAKEFERFKNKLLIFVAHHGQSTQGNVVEVSGDGAYSVEIPVAVLNGAAQVSGARLFLLGCSTSESLFLGTSKEITSKQATDGLARLFSKSIQTYGDVFSRLKDPAMELVFDIRFEEDRKLRVTTPPRRRGASYGKVEWTIPDIDSTHIPSPPADTSSAPELVPGSRPYDWGPISFAGAGKPTNLGHALFMLQSLITVTYYVCYAVFGWTFVSTLMLAVYAIAVAIVANIFESNPEKGQSEAIGNALFIYVKICTFGGLYLLGGALFEVVFVGGMMSARNAELDLAAFLDGSAAVMWLAGLAIVFMKTFGIRLLSSSPDRIQKFQPRRTRHKKRPLDSNGPLPRLFELKSKHDD